ncbi:hypothetical protein RHGRI_021723 [Rhododendron griersonianum]|uniref:Uncharacterized protein n=1 Tax=Rhododendron griersonianum TaxID=479676 RepID=A0AAV6JQA9_9ERIC|nr:hypothetical protein RHGRI_021723 [Rhododendron griersonianum]
MWIQRTHPVGALQNCFIVVDTGSSLSSSSPSSSSPEAIGLRRRDGFYSVLPPSYQLFENMYLLPPQEQFLAARTVNFSTK